MSDPETAHYLNQGKSVHRSVPLALVMGVFTLSIFLSAMLLFSVQPMFTKMTLPLLGGASNVWNTAMVFFQGTLLGGYLYAHLISKHFQLKAQIIIHSLILSLGLFFLPLAIASGWTPPEGGAQAVWLIALFAVSIGVPFLAISANAPLLQRWFSYTRHKDAGDPYFLYAASNFGSLHPWRSIRFILNLSCVLLSRRGFGLGVTVLYSLLFSLRGFLPFSCQSLKTR